MTERAQNLSDNAQLVRRGLASVFQPGAVLWGQTGADLGTGVLAASTSADQSRDRLSKLTRRVFGLGPLFAG